MLRGKDVGALNEEEIITRSKLIRSSLCIHLNSADNKALPVTDCLVILIF